MPFCGVALRKNACNNPVCARPRDQPGDGVEERTGKELTAQQRLTALEQRLACTSSVPS